MKVLAGAFAFLRKHNRMDNYVTRETVLTDLLLFL